MSKGSIADKAYDSNRLLEQIQNQGCEAIIPLRRNCKILGDFDKELYKERHLIECFFGKIKQFRRVFTRFDKKATSFLGFLTFASLIIWMR